MKIPDLGNISLHDVRKQVSEKNIFAAFLLLQKMKESPIPAPGVWLEWAKLTTYTPFSYLGILGTERELQLHQSAEAKEFLALLTKKLLDGRARSSKEYPKISLVGVVKPGSEKLWKRCIDSLALQFNTLLELKIITLSPESTIANLPEFVSCEFSHSSNLALIYDQAIRQATGDIFGVIDDPSTIFSDHGLLLVAATFKTNAEVHILQTERLTHGVEGVATPIRHELPEWSQALLLDPICLKAPSMVFEWRGTFFRRKTLLESALPLDQQFPFASALNAASKIARNSLIHSLRVPVVVDETPLEARSFKVPLAQISDAIEIIDRETRLSSAAFKSESPEVIEIEAKRHYYHTFPRINTMILSHGQRIAPRITLVTTVLNDQKHIARCIESILSQNYPNLEYIILDGGSTDGTKEIIERYRKFLFHYSSQPDAGHYAAIQKGLSLSNGEIMSWLNSDDILCPYTLALTASIFTERSEIEWLTGRIAMTSEQNDLDIALNTFGIDGTNYFEDAYDRPFIQQEGTFWRRSLWKKAGSALDLRLKLAADMELWTRFFQHANLYSLTVPLGVFMRRRGQRSTTLRNQYHFEAYSVIEKLRADGVKPFPLAANTSTILGIPLEQEIGNLKINPLSENRGGL